MSLKYREYINRLLSCVDSSVKIDLERPIEDIARDIEDTLHVGVLLGSMQTNILFDKDKWKRELEVAVVQVFEFMEEEIRSSINDLTFEEDLEDFKEIDITDIAGFDALSGQNGLVTYFPQEEDEYEFSKEADEVAERYKSITKQKVEVTLRDALSLVRNIDTTTETLAQADLQQQAVLDSHIFALESAVGDITEPEVDWLDELDHDEHILDRNNIENTETITGADTSDDSWLDEISDEEVSTLGEEQEEQEEEPNDSWLDEISDEETLEEQEHTEENADETEEDFFNDSWLDDLPDEEVPEEEVQEEDTEEDWLDAIANENETSEIQESREDEEEPDWLDVLAEEEDLTFQEEQLDEDDEQEDWLEEALEDSYSDGDTEDGYKVSKGRNSEHFDIETSEGGSSDSVPLSFAEKRKQYMQTLEQERNRVEEDETEESNTPFDGGISTDFFETSIDNSFSMHKDFSMNHSTLTSVEGAVKPTANDRFATMLIGVGAKAVEIPKTIIKASKSKLSTFVVDETEY